MTPGAKRTPLIMALAWLPIIGLATAGLFVQVPFVAMAPGPTVNVLGEEPDADKPRQIIEVKGTDVYPPQGHLNMTTVAVHNGLSLVQALFFWASGDEGIVPRSQVYPPDQSEDDVRKENQEEFADSENSAQVAALRALGHPMRLAVANVGEDAPAKDVLRDGDIVVGLNGKPVEGAGDFRKRVGKLGPGATAAIDVRRGETTQTVEVALGKRPDDDKKGFLGVKVVDEPDVPFEVTIHLEDIGGPSAGLIFSLGVIDKLTAGDLTGGKFVAGTGTIDSDGSVGPIGGIEYKLIAARREGAEFFLVPDGNCREAAAHTPKGLTLVRVATLEGAREAMGKVRAGQPVEGCD